MISNKIDKELNRQLFKEYINEKNNIKKKIIKDKIFYNNYQCINICFSKYYKHLFEYKEDFIQEASIILYNLIDKYDYSFIDISDFSTYATASIKDSILKTSIYDLKNPLSFKTGLNSGSISRIKRTLNLYANLNIHSDFYKIAYLNDYPIDKITSIYPHLYEMNFLREIEGDEYLISDYTMQIETEEEVFMKENEYEIVNNAFNKLNYRERSILLMRYCDDIKLKDIAKVYNLTKQAVSAIELKAVAKLKKQMEVSNG